MPPEVPPANAQRPGRASAIVVAIVVLATLGAAVWWFDARTRAETVAKRVAAQIVDRHAGASVARLNEDVLRVTMPSGVYIDARLAPVFDACRADRFACTDAIDRAAADVEQVEALLAKPTKADVRARVIGETSPGFRFGFVTEPLIGALEVRYALVAGVASTFVTQALAARLSADRSELRRAALLNLAAGGEPRVEVLPDRPGVYRVVSQDDAAVELLDASRMRKLAAIVGSARVDCAITEGGALFLARSDAAGKQALTTMLAGPKLRELPLGMKQERRGAARPGKAHVFVYDTEAPEGRTLSEVGAGP